MKGLKILILTLLFPVVFVGQDLHFSQFMYSPINMNPALTGDFYQDMRATLNHRNQWGSITVPFNTYSFALEGKAHNIINNRRIKRSLKVYDANIGILVNKDKAGDSEFGTTQIGLAFSGSYVIPKYLDHKISGGLLFNFYQRNLNYSNLTFDSQYGNNQYNPALGTNENFDNEGYSYMDFAAGLLYTYEYSSTLVPRVGISHYHINKPNKSFYESGDVKLFSRTVVHADLLFTSKKKYSLNPGIYYHNQNKQKDIIIGTDFLIDMGVKPLFEKDSTNKKSEVIILHAGAWLRAKDAVILLIGADYKKIYLGLSYDINISKLRTVSNSAGGFEVALMYYFNLPTKSKRSINYDRKKGQACPSFM